jgi:CRP/FNR family transcriptional regulator
MKDRPNTGPEEQGSGAAGILRNAIPRAHAPASPCSACPVRDVSFCNALTDEELGYLNRISSDISLTAGQSLFDEGAPAEHVFNVTNGVIKVYKLLSDGRRQITGFLFPGDFLGLATREVYAYGAEAVCGAQLCRFNRRKLEGMLKEFPKVERRLLGIASDELALAQDQMLILGRKTAKEKIASFLLMLSDRARKSGHQSNPIFLPITRNDIADSLGLTTETVSRTITQLKTSGLITLLPGNEVRLENRSTLENMAEGE